MLDIVNELFQPKVSLSVEGIRRVMDSFLDESFKEVYMQDTFMGMLTGRREIIESILSKMIGNEPPYVELGASKYEYNHNESDTLVALKISKEEMEGIASKYLGYFEKIVTSDITKEEQLGAVKTFIKLLYADEGYDTNTKTFLLTHILRELAKHIVTTCSLAINAETGLDTKTN